MPSAPLPCHLSFTPSSLNLVTQFISHYFLCGLPQWLSSKDSASNVGDMGSIPGSGRFPGEGNGNPLQYSCLGNPIDRGAWWAIVHGVTKSWIRLRDNTTICILLRYPSSYTHSLAVCSRANNLRWLLVLIKLIHVAQLLFLSEGTISCPVPAICWPRTAPSICQHLEPPWKWLGCASILGKALSLEETAVWGQWGDTGLTWQGSPEGRNMALLQGRDFCFNAENTTGLVTCSFLI